MVVFEELDKENPLYYEKLFDSTDEQAKAFMELAEMFFHGNFGTASKAEIELKMFSIYMNAVISKNNTNNVLDYNASSDYKIAKQLGIPQEKVRSLKVKKQARYPVKYDWKESLNSIKDQVYFDETKRRMILPLRDPNLYNEIQNFIEENGGYVEIQRGKNCIQMRPECFFLLIYDGIQDENEKMRLRNNLVKELRERNQNADISDIHTDEEMALRALELGEVTFDFFIDVLEGISNPLVSIMKGAKIISHIIKKNKGK